MIHVLSSVERYNNPLVSTARMIIPVKLYQERAQQRQSTYNMLTCDMWLT